MDAAKWTDIVSAVSAAVSALAVIVAMWQLRATKIIHQLEFEDSLDKEYRDLVARIPTKALIGSGLSPVEYAQAFDEFYRYFDLCNQQIILRMRKRIGQDVWSEWCCGIAYNIEKLPAFKRAWEDIKDRSDSFKEILRLQAEKFLVDPLKWTRT